MSALQAALSDLAQTIGATLKTASPEDIRAIQQKIALAQQAARSDARPADRVRALPVCTNGLTVPGITVSSGWTNLLSPDFPITFSTSGMIVGLQASVKGANMTTQDIYWATMCNFAVKITKQGAISGDVFTNGQVASFYDLISISSNAQPVFPFFHRVEANVVWNVAFQKASAGITDVIPSIKFLFIDDRLLTQVL